MRQQTSPLSLGKTLGQTGLTLGRIRVSAQCLLARQYHYGGGRTDQCEPAIQVPQRGEAGEVTLPRPLQLWTRPTQASGSIGPQVCYVLTIVCTTLTRGNGDCTMWWAKASSASVVLGVAVR
jgi:hypothetical protein